MKKYVFILISFLLCLSYAYSKEEKYDLSPLELNKPMYWLFGDMNNQAKCNISFKYNILKKYESGVFFGYSQLMMWKLYDKSSPFEDLNYNPEIFIKSKYFMSNQIDYIVISPFEHMSNGRDGEESRSLNRAYVQVQASKGNKLNVGINAKGYIYYNSDNGYENYSSFYETKLFISIDRVDNESAKDELYVKFGGYKYWFTEVGYISRKFGFMNPRFYAQLYHGYLESMLRFNEKTTAIRIGVVFK